VTRAQLALLLYYDALMISGCCMIGLLWGSAGAPYAIPRRVFFLFGVVSPMIQMFFSTVAFGLIPSAISLLCPISFAFLWFLGSGARRNMQDLRNRCWEAELIEIEQALHERPDNPGFYLRKAKLLDSAGLAPEALQTYRQVHQVSTKFFTEYEMRQIEERLGPAGRLRLADERHAGRPRSYSWLPDLRRGWILCLLAAAPVGFLDAARFAGVLSVWLFVAWYNAAQAD
jgi:hypothetical protein